MASPPGSYSTDCSTRVSFMKKLQELLEDDYEDFKLLGKVDQSYFVLGSELKES